jgi:predicted nucleic acid-binding protein
LVRQIIMDKHNKVLLDTNILVYSINQKSELYKPARKFIEELLESEMIIYIPDKALYELYRVLSSRAFLAHLNQKEAYQIWQQFAFSKAFEVIYSDEKILKTTDKLLEMFPQSHIFDLQIMACGLVNKVDVIYTNNTKDFPAINEIKIVSPLIEPIAKP